MNKKLQNHIYLIIFCALIGGFAGTVIWVFLKIMSVGMEFLWESLPEQMSSPLYPLAICTVGGAIAGIFRKKFGDYPEELHVVMGKVRQEKHYDYKKMPIFLCAALIPLLIESSVGPEAGLVGIIVALCYWAGDNLKFAHENTREYSEMGVAVTLSVLFHSPLFGIFAVEEDQENEEKVFQMTKSSKIFVYGIGLAAGAGCYKVLSNIFGAGLSGFPSFEAAEPVGKDFAMLIVYVVAGCILAWFYEITHKGFHTLSEKIPAVVKEVIAGACLGVAGMFLPILMFSGEEEMGALMTEFVEYLPWMLIGIAFLKILLTNLCIQFGLKGGHFFPMIFSGVCMGYGMAMFVFGNSGEHVVFAAAIVTAAMLGGTMKKPIAVTMLLFICFPVRMFVWIFLAAVLGSKCMSFITDKKELQGEA